MRKLAEEVMPVRCSGCAYTAGTVANKDSLTTVTRELCELGRVSFYCHANATDDKLPHDGKRVCLGFRDVLLTQTITNREPKRWQRLLAEEGLRIMEEVEDDPRLAERSEEEITRELIARVERRLKRQQAAV